ncbi:retropepsin-like aspartic protease [Roseomonas sp. BN140053]|uniref:retropepsin-like aspartic protease n=1 Tax=Roseomonas sp. BN140053 TaxID=3391898 RepID=UPI0039EA3CA8
MSSAARAARRPAAAAREARRAVLAVLLLAPAACAAGPGCVAGREDRVPLTLAAGLPLVPARINGRPVQLVLDTGASGLALTPTGAARLRLPVRPDGFQVAPGAGGAGVVPGVSVALLEFGGLRLDNLSAPVVPSPVLDGLDGGGASGVLGGDALAGAEIELDLPARRATTFRGEACRAAAPAWDGASEGLPTWRAADQRLGVRLRVNGVELPAILDTGASRSLISGRAASRLGPEAAALPGATSEVRGFGPQVRRAELRRFREVQLGREVLRDVPLLVLDDLPEEAELVLGADLLATRRLWVSYATGRVFVQPAAAPLPGSG